MTTTIELNKLKYNIDTIRENILDGSYNLRLLCESNVIGNLKLDSIRNDIINDAQVFKIKILPLVQVTVESIRSVFNIYRSMDYNTWVEELNYIVNDIDVHVNKSDYLSCVCGCMLHSFSDRSRDLNNISNELKLDIDVTAEEIKIEQSALNTKYYIAFASGLIPVIGPFLGPLITMHYNKLRDTTAAKKARLESLTIILSLHVTNMLPVIKSFINVTSGLSGFFHNLSSELREYKDDCNKSIEVKRKTHYCTMKQIAEDIYKLCRDLISVIPYVISNIDTSQVVTDVDYVDNWLKNRKYPNTNITLLEAGISLYQQKGEIIKIFNKISSNEN